MEIGDTITISKVEGECGEVYEIVSPFDLQEELKEYNKTYKKNTTFEEDKFELSAHLIQKGLIKPIVKTLQ